MKKLSGKIFTLQIVFALIFSFTAVYADISSIKGNLIINGDFETGTTENWSNYQGSLAVSESDTYDGNYSLSVTASELQYRGIPVTPGDTYILSAALKGKYKNGLYARILTDETKVKIGEVKITTAENWENRAFIAKMPDDADKLRIIFFSYNSSWKYGDFFVDDVYFGKLSLKGDIIGESIVSTGNTPKTYTYSAKITNQLGNNEGVSGDYAPDITWSLNNATSDITINSQTGELLVSENAASQNIEVCATVSSPLKNSGVNDIVIKKAVSIEKLPDANEVLIDKTVLTLYKGEIFQLNADVLPENAADKNIIWSSDNKEVADVDENGVVTAISSGQAKIRATAVSGVYGECVVTVPEDVDYVTDVIIDKNNLVMKVDDKDTLSATILPKNTSIKKVEWKSDNENVCKIDADGNIVAVGKGSAVITACAGAVFDICTVNVTGYPDYYFSESDFINLYPNPGFEEGNTDGYKEDIAKLEINSDKEYIKSGNYSGHFIGSDIKGTGYVQMRNIAVESDTVYFATVWMNRINGTTTRYAVDGGKGITGGMEGYLELKDNWKAYTFWYKTGSDETALNLIYATIGLSASAYIDDFMFTKFNLKNTISGADEITIPESGTVTEKYTAKVTNPADTQNGIEEEPKIRWYLKNDIEGIELDEQTGELTVSSNVSACDIELYCKSESYNTSVGKTLSGISKKVVSVVPIRAKADNLIISADLSENNCTLTAKYDYSHPKGLTESGSKLLWSISDKKEEGYLEYSKNISCALTKNDSDKYIKFSVIPVGTDNTDGKILESESIKISELFDKAPEISVCLLKADGKIGVNTKVTADVSWQKSFESTYECNWFYSDNIKASDKRSAEYIFKASDVEKNIYAIVYPYTEISGFRIYGEEKKTNVLTGPVKPEAKDVTVFGTIVPGMIVTGKYTYSNKNDVAEGNSSYSWTVGGSEAGTSASYTIKPTDAGKYIVFTVIPEGKDGTKGAPVSSAPYVISTGISGSISHTGGSSGGGFSGGSSSSGGFSGGGSSSSAVTPPPSVSTPQKTTFSDTQGHWAEKEITAMADSGIASGMGNNKFNPDESITRAQLIAFVIRGLKLEEVSYEGKAKDIQKGAWYDKIIGTAIKNKLIDDAENIRPDDSITREEMTKIIVNAYELNKKIDTESFTHNFEDNISPWAVMYVNKASKAGLINGMSEKKFGSKSNATRAQGLVVVKRLLDKIN